jgi:ribosomal protein S18 acetylase RimI-like enzyme
MDTWIEYSKKFLYTSLSYVDEKDLKDYQVIASDPHLLLYKMEHDIMYLHYASSDALITDEIKHVIASTKTSFPSIKEVRIEFIPESWVSRFEAIGFVISSHFVDYWLSPLAWTDQILDATLEIDEMKMDDLFLFSEITQSNRLKSRGYYGEPIDFASEFLKDPHTKIYAAKMNTKIVAVCATKLYNFEHPKGPILWLREIAVSPLYHQRGIGEKLMTYALNQGYQHGARQSFLACDVDNRYGIKLYEKLGYLRNDDPGQINMIFYHTS